MFPDHEATKATIRPRGIGTLFFLATLTGLLILLLLAGRSEGREIVVDQQGGGDYDELPKALTAAEEGDEILLEPGNYPADFPRLMPKSGVTIIGRDKNESRLMFQNSGSWLLVSGKNDFHLRNLNITTGPKTENNAIVLTSSKDSSIANCSIYSLKRIQLGPYISEVSIANCSLWKTPLQLSPASPEETLSNSLPNNTLNGRLMLYLKNESELKLSGVLGGVILVNCSDLTLSGLELGPGSNGMIVSGSTNITLEDSLISTTHSGLVCRDSTGLQVRRTIFPEGDLNLGDPALYSLYSQGLTVEDCGFNGSGIHIRGGENHRITGNVLGGEAGITLQLSSAAVVEDNSMEMQGLSLFDGSWSTEDEQTHFSQVVSNNTVGGKPLRYYLGASEETVPGNTGQLILVNCRNMEAEEMELAGPSTGILLMNSTDCRLGNSSITHRENGITLLFSEGNIFRSMEASGGVLGAYFYDSHHNLLLNSSFSGTSDHGLRLTKANGSVVRDCAITGSGNEGIFVLASQGLWFQGNTISGSRDTGVYLTNCQNITLTGNTITDNGAGVYLKKNPTGIRLFNNNIWNNPAFGLEVFESNGFTIDARYNWWGDETGPRHAASNPDGKGSGVTLLSSIKPWLEEPWGSVPGEEDPVVEEEDLGLSKLLPFLITLLLIHFILLGMLARTPASLFNPGNMKFPEQDPKPQEREAAPSHTEESRPPLLKDGSCPHCGGGFDVESVWQPRTFNCHFCGKAISLDEKEL